jgi:hypothetical protein
MYALGGVMRGGASRGGYVSNRVFVFIDGTPFVPPREPGHIGILLDSLTIHDELDATPNTCSFRVNGAVPAAGAEIVLTRGSQNTNTRLFGGFALTVNQIYAADRPANVQADVACVDYTWLFGFVKVTRTYRDLSASDIAAHLIQDYAAVNGFVSLAVPNLPVLNEITFSNEDLDTAFSRLARRIGAYWFVDYAKGVHLFFEETGNGAPEPLTPTHKSLADFERTADRTQVLTRVYVEGRGTTVLTAVPAGETHIPVQTVEMFAPVAADLFLKVSPQGSSGGAQLLTFQGGTPGSGGALVGPGVGPTTAPALALATGAGLESGTHRYGVTYVTATGESFLSPLAEIVTGTPLPNPITPPTVTDNPTGTYNGSYIAIGDTVKFCYAHSTSPVDSPVPAKDWPVTLTAVATPPHVTISNNDPLNPTNSAPMYVRTMSSNDPRVQSVMVWMASVNTGNRWGLLNVAKNQPGVYATVDTVSRGYPIFEGPNYVPPPAVNTTGIENRVTVSQIPKHATTAVTARKLYRAAVNTTTPLKLLATIADNTTTTYADSTPDASLGATAPVTDTSGLQPAGQVPAGSTSLVVSGTVAFEVGGGWAIVGNGEQVIRYHALSATALIGIPATGAGSITATLAYNSAVSAPPMITNVSGLVRPLVEGDEIYAVVQRDDTARQSAVADMVNSGPGIREEWVQDRRLSLTEARARGDTTLAMRPLEDVTVRYRCRDLRTAAGKTITVNLPAPTNVQGTFKIQSVTVDHFRPVATQPPTFTVTASSQRFSFEDWLRRMHTKV